MDLFTDRGLLTLLQVVFIDLVLAGDNAIVIGMAAASLPPGQRRKAIMIGIAAATLLRIAFATIAVSLLEIIGLILVGGLLLLWVCWKMWRELLAAHVQLQAANKTDAALHGDTRSPAVPAGAKTLRQAATQIVAADLSMSVDNVLAVAGAAREHPTVLAIGLLLSITLMGLLANYIARLLDQHRWIAYLGLAIILYVALDMIYRGSVEVAPHLSTAAAQWIG